MRLTTLTGGLAYEAHPNERKLGKNGLGHAKLWLEHAKLWRVLSLTLIDLLRLRMQLEDHADVGRGVELASE